MKYSIPLRENNSTIPVFFACDDKYTKYMMVTIASLIAHASPWKKYNLHVLHTNISEDNQKKVISMEQDNIRIRFHNVNSQIEKVVKKLAIRNYYSISTYYRVFIADMFPEYDKVLYIDSDTIIMKDVSHLYSYNIGDNLIGAVNDYIVSHVDVFGIYVENVLGISRASYFNAGVVLLNTKQFRKQNILKEFLNLLHTYSFVVAQDQDYLNILCQEKVFYLDSRWNIQMSEDHERAYENLYLIHYNFAEKPWLHKDCRYSQYFWDYAQKTADYELLLEGLKNYSEEDRAREIRATNDLQNLAREEINNPENYFRRMSTSMNTDETQLTREEVIRKIEEYEREGRFDEDVENDPPGREILPGEVDYLRQNITNRIRTRYAFRVARMFVNSLIRKNQFIIKGYHGLENLTNLQTGAIITCNHFNAFDSFAMELTYEKAIPKPRQSKLFRIIKEGNYTSFPGFYGLLMRNCNTLPLSSNKDTMRKFIKAVNRILQKGSFVLIYPEQSLWWNYRKPKPLKKGGFTFAVDNGVPVIPVFITMEDTQYSTPEGTPVQAYTIHVGKPIYPDKKLKKQENIQMMMQKNAGFWKETYENFYKIPLTYSCDPEKLNGFYLNAN